MGIKRDKEFYARQNRVADKLAMTRMSPNESKYCWIVFRKTFLHGKYEDLIMRGLMAKLTGMDPTTASKVKTRLKKRNIIYANADVVGFRLNTKQWEEVKVSSLFEGVKVSSLNSEGRADKTSEGIVTLQRTNKVNNTKKVLSKPKETRIVGEVPQGLKDAREKLGRSMKKKKEEYSLNSRSQNKEK